MRNNKKRFGSMIGASAMGILMAGALTVPTFAADGNIDPDERGSLTVHKYVGDAWTGVENDGTVVTPPAGAVPLEDVDFELCKIDGLNVTETTDWAAITALNTAIQADPKHELPTGTTCTLVSTETTNAQGVAEWTDLDLGVYYVKETRAPAEVTEKTLPFLVSIPLSHSSGWIYDVNVYPKNAVMEDLVKEVETPNEFGIGAKLTYKITQTIPSTENGIEDYRIFDSMPDGLDFNNDSVIAIDGVELTEGTDYTIAASGKLYTLTFLEDGLALLNANGGNELTWSYTATVTAIGDGQLENESGSLVNNPSGSWTDASKPETGKESTFWGALKIKKVDTNDKTLAGATFQVFENQSDADDCVAEVVAADGNLPAGCSKGVVDTVTTDGTGFATVDGLWVSNDASITDKNYYLVETVAPAGFENANQAYEVKVTTGSVAEALTKDIENAQHPATTMPPTGGITNAALAVVGVLLIGGSVAIVIANQKRKAVNN